MEQTHALPPDLAQPPQNTEHLLRMTSWRACARASPRLERERDHLAAIVDILQEVSSSLHFVDVLQTIARKLGETFGLDRCSIFLSGDKDEVRLVASYEDPTIRNLIVDLNRYPELKRAFESGETVFIPDAANDPDAAQHQGARSTRATCAPSSSCPIRWEGSVIGAIFLRTERERRTVQRRATSASARRSPRSRRSRSATPTASRRCCAARRTSRVAQRKAELQRVALVGFLRRLLDRYAKGEEQSWAETLLPTAADEELERLVTVAMQVLDEEAKG